MRRGFPVVLGVLAVAGTLGTHSPAAAQAPAGKMVIFEFFERIT